MVTLSRKGQLLSRAFGESLFALSEIHLNRHVIGKWLAILMYIANQRNSILLVSKVLILKEIQRYMSLDLEGGEHSSAEILGKI